MDRHETRVFNYTIETGNCELNIAIRNWLKWNRNKKTSCEILTMLENKDYETLKARLFNRICFGTAGLRGKMRAGFDSLNDLVIIQTAQGLLTVLTETFPSSEFSRGVVIGYDGRHNSQRFANLFANVFVRNGVNVLLFTKTVCTPFVPFTILERKCLLGIMVTASHNPKDENGCKVYWENGAQIISPLDMKIQQAILEHLEPERKTFNTSILKDNPLITDPYDEIFKKYFELLKVAIPSNFRKINSESSLQTVYTALHGVGFPFIEEAFRVGKFRAPIAVEEQKLPDPQFPTVPNPNPEEGQTVLELALNKADAEGINLVIANDPDADRMIFAEKDSANIWKIFTGNEIGALFGWWTVLMYTTLAEDPWLGDVCMISSAVSSKILRSMATSQGFQFEETLTGFKWMGNRAIELKNAGKNVLFAFEEAIGFMIGMPVIDKDGISAAYHLMTMACYLKANEGKSLGQKLNEIWDKYGYHICKNGYMICADLKLILKMFNRLRTYQKNKIKTYPKSILDGEFPIASIRDMNRFYDSAERDERVKLPGCSGSQMITFRFKNGMEITFRTSGTEPKIKYYSEIITQPGAKDINVVEHTLFRMVDACVAEFFEPEKNNLVYTKCIPTVGELDSQEQEYEAVVNDAQPDIAPIEEEQEEGV